MLCALVCAGAHLGQSGLFVADLVFADGRQLLQRVPVVGERPCQPRKLGPSCRDEMWNTTFITTECAIRPSVRVDRVHGDSKDVTGVTKYSHCLQLTPTGFIFSQLLIHIYNKQGQCEHI